MYHKPDKHAYYLACLDSARRCPAYILNGDGAISATEWLLENTRAPIPDNLTSQDVRECRARAIRVARGDRRKQLLEAGQ